MKIKRYISLFLALTMLFSFMTVVNAAKFPDITSDLSWADEAINDMVERGILKGYTDGNFKPYNGMTKLEALIVAARIAGCDNEENADYAKVALDAYTTILNDYDIQYKNEIAYLLYKGILSESDLPNYIADGVKNNPLKRYEAAEFLAKMMYGVDDAKNTDADADYADINDIPAAAVPYVNFCFEKGVMNGMEDNKFMPYYEVNRAMMSVMMFRAEKAMNTEYISETVTAVSPTNSTITVSTVDGDQTLDIPSSAIIALDGKTASLSGIVPGLLAKITAVNEKIVMVEGLNSTVQFTTSGTIVRTSSETGDKFITIIPVNKYSDSDAVTYPISDACAYSVDATASSFTNMKANKFAVLKVKEGKVVSIAIDTKSKEYSGTISSVNTDEVISIDVKFASGSTSTYYFADKATVKRNNTSVQPSELSKGDTVSLTITAGKITYLSATSIKRSVQGTISEINISSSPYVVLTVGGEKATYTIDSDTTFTVDTKTDSTIYDLRLGATATLTAESTLAKNISTTALVMSNVVVGTVNYIHPTSSVMGIDVTNADGTVTTVQCVVKSTVKITDATASRISAFKNIAVGRSVVAVGTVNYGVYEITSITITE